MVLVVPYLAALALGPPAPPVQQRAPVAQEAVDAAVERGVGFLLERQDEDGAWRYESVVMPGATALALYALLVCDVDPDHEAVQRAVARLVRFEFGRTYDTSLAILALATLDRLEYAEWIEELAARLVAWQDRDGDWGYPAGGDLSNTQFAALGLRAAALAGADVPAEVWAQLLDATLGYRTRGGGFGYGPGSNSGTASMTAAGLGTLAICESLLARAGEAPGRPAALLESARAKALDWLEEHFPEAISTSRGSWIYYRLYGIERLGALLGLQHVGEHDWYEEGAAEIVAAQREDGSWSDFRAASLPLEPFAPETNDLRGDAEVSTAFALLFLRRATSRPATGGGIDPQREAVVFGTTAADAPLRVRATGQDPLTIWIVGWSQASLERLEWPGEHGRGPRVARVEVLVDGRAVAQVEGSTARPADTERFALRHRFPRQGTYTLQVRALALAPPGTDGAPGGELVAVVSPAFEVEIREVVPAWKREQQGDRARNLLLAAGPRASASSVFAGGQGLPEGVAHPAALAVDNRSMTSWLARSDDDEPTLTITLARATRANRVLISGARSVPHRAGFFARPLELEVTVDGRDRYRVPMPPDERMKGRLELPRTQRVRKLELRILRSVPGRGHPSTGLAEVELQLR